MQPETALECPDKTKKLLDVSIFFTEWELATYDTPEALRQVLDAKMLSLRNVAVRGLREYCHREVAP